MDKETYVSIIAPSLPNSCDPPKRLCRQVHCLKFWDLTNALKSEHYEAGGWIVLSARMEQKTYHVSGEKPFRMFSYLVRSCLGVLCRSSMHCHLSLSRPGPGCTGDGIKDLSQYHWNFAKFRSSFYISTMLRTTPGRLCAWQVASTSRYIFDVIGSVNHEFPYRPPPWF